MKMFKLHHFFFCMAKTTKILKQDIVKNIEIEAIVPSINKNFFHQHMVSFVNKLKFNDNTYQTNGTLRDEGYQRKFLFTMTDLVSFGADRQ